MLTGVYIDQEGEAHVYRGIVSQVEAELLAAEGKIKLIACLELPPERVCLQCGEANPWQLTKEYRNWLGHLSYYPVEPLVWDAFSPCIFCGSSF